MSRRAALMPGTILVVSGPTVVGPLLNFVRPIERIQRILLWEGTIIDPIGAILGAVTLNVIILSTHTDVRTGLAQLVLSLSVGVLGGVVGTVVLWLLLRVVGLDDVLGTAVQLATVMGTAAACDAVRDDTGLVAAIIMGLAAANLSGFAIPARRPFFETLVQLTIGLLFISISASVTPGSLRHVVLPSLGLVAVLALVARPLVALLATWRSGLRPQERAFIGWMAPRGIVAAATASVFSAALVAKGIPGAERILPATFIVIVTTVSLYGLTALPVARRLRAIRSARSRPLLVGGDVFVTDIALAFRSAGLEVLLWSGRERRGTGSDRPVWIWPRANCWPP